MVKKINIFQFGGNSISFPDTWLERYKYTYLPGNYDLALDDMDTKLFINNHFNSKFSRSVFILGDDSTLLYNFPMLLEQFPAYQVVYDINAIIPENQKSILDKKYAFKANFLYESKILESISKLSKKQYGYKISMDDISINNNFRGKALKLGNSKVILSGDFGDNDNQVISWRIHQHGIQSKSILEFYPEIYIKSGDLSLEFKILVLDQNNDEIDDVIIGTPVEFQNKIKLIRNESELTKNISVSLYVSGGRGEIEIGQVHFREFISDDSTMINGGKKIIDTYSRSEEVFHYFNPGDFKPPLAVYFSGYRSAEGFEGLGMMSKMKCPFMLIADPRLEGGDFYIGNKDFEDEITKIITDKLELLGFSNRQLILSGLSMGTFSSLYYAKDLEPAAVIVGKPLANIGDIAKNERINRPEIWGTSLDMIIKYGNVSNNEVADKLNSKFWDKFDSGNFNHTKFLIAYMKDDDYDKNAFIMIKNSLINNSPEAIIISKGIIGRHNDNSPAVNSWFIKQFRNIFLNDFDREIDYRV